MQSAVWEATREAPFSPHCIAVGASVAEPSTHRQFEVTSC
jgi:hypothetical protein